MIYPIPFLMELVDEILSEEAKLARSKSVLSANTAIHQAENDQRKPQKAA